MLSSKKLLPFAIAVATCMSAPAVVAQNLGVAVKAGGAARAQLPVTALQAQGNINANANINPQAATPAVPATPADPAMKPEASSTTATELQAASPAVPATPAMPAKKGWNELDANGNGSLSVSEVATMESLAKVFVKADADANGELTQDEYKTWLASNGKAGVKGKSGS